MTTKKIKFSDYETAYNYVVSLIREHTCLKHACGAISSLICKEGVVFCADKHYCIFINHPIVEDVIIAISCIRDKFDNYIIVFNRP